MSSLLNKLTGGGHSKETTENRAVPSSHNDPKAPGEYRHTGDESFEGRTHTGDANPVTGGGYVGGLAAQTGDAARTGETGRIAENRREEGNVVGHGLQETGLKSGSGADIGFKSGEHNTPSNLTSTDSSSTSNINFHPVRMAAGEYVVKDSVTGEPHFTNPAGYKDFGSSSTGVSLEHSALREKLHGHGHGDVVNPSEATGVFGQRNEGHGLGATTTGALGAGGVTAGVGAMALGEKDHHSHGGLHPDSRTEGLVGGNNYGTAGTATSGSTVGGIVGGGHEHREEGTKAKSGLLEKMGVKAQPEGGAGPGHELQEELDLHKKGKGIHEDKHVEELSTSGPHGLVLDPETGKYVHRRELDHKGSTGVPLK